MDSTTDTPIILTEEFAAQAAQGIAAAVRSVYGLSPAEDQEYGRWLAHMERYLKERAGPGPGGGAGRHRRRPPPQLRHPPGGGPDGGGGQ